MMKVFLNAFVLSLLACGSAVAADFDDAKRSHIEYPDWFVNDPFFDLAEALASVKAEGKHGLMVLWTTQGCSYCSAFIDKSLGDPAISERVQEHFASVGLEIFDDKEMTDPRGTQLPIKRFAELEGAGFSPTLVFYAPDGTRVARAVGYLSPERFTAMLDYVVTAQYRSEALPDYYKRVSPKAAARAAGGGMKDDPLFGSPPYALDRSRFPADRPLLVLFEQSACGECEAFHAEVLALPEVRDALSRFEVVRLDALDDRTPVLAPDGSRVDPASWFKKAEFSRAPALLFFDENGKEVLKTDALVRRQRMVNSLNFVLERAYEKNWTYQRFARSKAIERNLEEQRLN
jgi:thioredoxin-related protein